MYDHVGAVLKEARISKGLTQLELAKQLGFTTSQYISNIERGMCSLSAYQARRIARLLDYPFERFVEAAAADYKMRYLVDSRTDVKVHRDR